MAFVSGAFADPDAASVDGGVGDRGRPGLWDGFVLGAQVQGVVGWHGVDHSVGCVPFVAAAGQASDGEAAFVAESVVVAAPGVEVAAVGGSVVGPFLPVVLVADVGGSAAAGGAAFLVAGFDERFFGGVGSAADVAVMEQVAVGVGDGEFPGRVGLLILGDLPGLSGVSICITSMSLTGRHRCSYGSL